MFIIIHMSSHFVFGALCSSLLNFSIALVIPSNVRPPLSIQLALQLIIWNHVDMEYSENLNMLFVLYMMHFNHEFGAFLSVLGPYDKLLACYSLPRYQKYMLNRRTIFVVKRNSTQLINISEKSTARYTNYSIFYVCECVCAFSISQQKSDD